MSKNKYVENGVKLSKVNVVAGEELTVTYNGLLAASGAGNVYAHVGFGDDWNEVVDVPMKRDKKGDFKAKIKIAGYESLNMCFKDDVNNWDNNHSLNYSFEVLNKKPEAKKTSKTTKASSTQKETKSATKDSKAKSTEKKTSKTKV